MCEKASQAHCGIQADHESGGNSVQRRVHLAADSLPGSAVFVCLMLPLSVPTASAATRTVGAGPRRQGHQHPARAPAPGGCEG